MPEPKSETFNSTGSPATTSMVSVLPLTVIVTVPFASAGKITLIRAFSPTLITISSTLIVELTLSIFVVVELAAVKYLSSLPEYDAFTVNSPETGIITSLNVAIPCAMSVVS